jgi:hypothetical protein
MNYLRMILKKERLNPANSLQKDDNQFAESCKLIQRILSETDNRYFN